MVTTAGLAITPMNDAWEYNEQPAMNELPDDPPGTVDFISQGIGERGKLTRQAAKHAAKLWKECLRRQPQAHITLSISGYDDDPRALWEFDEVKRIRSAVCTVCRDRRRDGSFQAAGRDRRGVSRRLRRAVQSGRRPAAKNY
jgi:hypothetical protein